MNTSISRQLACLVVTFNPDLQRLGRLIAQLYKSQVAIYVVDNFFSTEASTSISGLCSNPIDQLTLIALDKNYGIAKALNIGIEAARQDQHEFIMLLDQDSVPQDGLLQEMLIAANNLADQDDKVAAIGSRLYDPRSGHFFKFVSLKWGLWRKQGCSSGNGTLMPCEFINSSGSLIFLRHWREIGPFREDFFIDHVETEWYMRVRHLGLRCYGLCSKNYLEHLMGDDVCRYWLFGWHYMPRRSPQRHYTIVRNALWMWHLKQTPLAWIINSALKVISTLIYFTAFDKDRKSQFLFILKGVRDGLFTKPSTSMEHPFDI